MSEAATDIAKREGMMAEAVKDFVKKHFPEFALTGIDVSSGSKSARKVPTPDETARELMEALYPDLLGDFSSSANHRRGIALLVIKKWASKLAGHFLDGMNAAEAHVERQTELLKISRDTLLLQETQIKDLQSELTQVREVRGTYADKAKEALQVKVDNAERLHLTDRQLLQTALRELNEARAELEGHKTKAAGLERDLSLLMKAVSGNAEAPKKADAWLAKAVEKCYEFWGENARRSPTAQLVLADLIKARVELQPLMLVGTKPVQEKTG